MSKAFTKESDDDAEQQALPPRPALPPGTKNYLTRDSADRYQVEVQKLLQLDRPAIASQPPTPEQKVQLNKIDLRIRQLQDILQTTVVVDPSGEKDRVRFGNHVKILEPEGAETYRIVGVDEIDLDRNWISWQSPLARALLNRQQGEKIRFKSPSGERILEILEIA